jgi:hypothetical protein
VFIDKKKIGIDFTDKKYLTLSNKWAEDCDEQDMFIRLRKEVGDRNTYWAAQKANAQEDLDIYNGNPFTPTMLKRYKEEKMKPVANKRVKRNLNTIADNVFRGRQIGVIKQTVKEDGSIPANDIQNIINKIMSDNKFEYKAYNNILKSAMITGFFTYAELEIEGQINGIGKPRLLTYDWDCILPAPMFNNNFWDCNDIVKINYMSPNDLLSMFPQRSKAIIDFIETNYDNDYVVNLENTIRANTQQALNKDIIASADANADDLGRGMITLYDWIRPLYVQTVVYVNPDLADEVLLPPQWERERITAWEEMHPEHQKEERVQKVLWRTIWTANGLILYNNEHWYQNDCELNGCLFACEMANRKPEGFIRIAVDLIRMLSAAQTEGLYQIATGSGLRAEVKDGALKVPENFENELKKRISIIEYNEDANLNDIRISQKQPSMEFINYAQAREEELDRTLGITDDIEGRTKASSSNFRTETAILQTMTSYAEYMRNITEWWLVMTNVYLSAIPYIFTDKEIKYTTLPSGERSEGSEIEINQKEVVEEQDEDGRIYYALKTIANDPTKGKYAYLVYKDSPSALSLAENNEYAMTFLNGLGNTLFEMDRKTLVNILSAHEHNPILSKLGANLEKQMIEEEKQQEEQAGGMPQGEMPNQNPQLDGNAMAQQMQPSGEIPQQMLMDAQGLNNAPMGFVA